MQSGFDPPPPPPGGYPPPPPYLPQPGNQPLQGQFAQQNPYAQNPYGPQQFIPPAPGYVQPMGGYGGYGYAPPTDGKATASLVLGLLSIFCFGILAGIPAVIFGFLAHRDISKSGGALGGRGMATGGIVVGSLGTFGSIAWIGMMIFGFATASKAASSITPYPTGYPTFTIPTPPPTASTGVASGLVPSTELHGNLKVVSLGTGDPLQNQLMDLRTAETAVGRIVIVQTTAKWCEACHEIATTFDDPLLEKALDRVTLIEVDADEFESELAALKMQTNAIPFFFKIDSTGHPIDAISGDEWDANTAANEAPVLGAFAKGTLKKRRHPAPLGTSL